MKKYVKKVLALGLIFFVCATTLRAEKLVSGKVDVLDIVLVNMPTSFEYMRHAAESARDVYKAIGCVNIINAHDSQIIREVICDSISSGELFKNLQSGAKKIDTEYTSDDFVIKEIEVRDAGGLIARSERKDIFLSSITIDEESDVNKEYFKSKKSTEEISSDEEILTLVLRKTLFAQCKDFFAILHDKRYKKYMSPLLEESIGANNLSDSVLYKFSFLDTEKSEKYLEQHLVSVRATSNFCYELLSFIRDLFESFPKALEKYKERIKEKVEAKKEESLSRSERKKLHKEKKQKEKKSKKG